MRRILTVAVLPVLAVLALSGCVAPSSGPVVTEERDVDEVTAVVFNSSGELVIRVGEPSLTITGPEDALEKISTESGDDLLVIAATGSSVSWGDLRFELSMPAISTVKAAGSGDIEVDFAAAPDVHVALEGSGDVEGVNIDSATVSVSASGSGGVELSGTTIGLSVRLDGSGEADLENLAATDVFVTIDGSADATVQASRMLRVDLSGSGSVHYTGDAEVTSDISGSGEVVKD